MFRLKFNLEGATGMPSIMKVPTGTLGAETTFKAGEALCYSSGKLVAASGAVKAEWVAVADKTLPSAGGYIDAIRVTPSLVFETPIEDYDSTVHKIGAKVAFASDGLGLDDAAAYDTKGGETYSATGAVFAYGAKIIDMQGVSADNGKVLVVLA